MRTRRQRTKQDAQRARMSQRRRFRGPPERQHGERSQSGVAVRSIVAWKKYVARATAKFKEVQRREELKAGWRAREAEKREEAEKRAR